MLQTTISNPTTTTIPSKIPSGSAPGSVEDTGDANNYVVWRRPGKRILFRDWYTTNFCTLDHVREIAAIQDHPVMNNPFTKLYFKCWTVFADLEFFAISIPPLLWGGWPFEAFRIVSMLFWAQYVNSCGKDYCGCPRPPCPPLRLSGNAKTHSTEYGFPSSHAAHSGIFTYFFYTMMAKYVFPSHKLYCFIFAVVYFSHIAFSRLYLAMHWKMDLIGGWLVALSVVLIHTTWLDSFEFWVATHPSGLLGYVVLFAVVAFLATVHPVPHENCPCYVDTVKFLGTMTGYFIGCWCFMSRFGTLYVREEKPLLIDTMWDKQFFLQLVPGLALSGVAKEGGDFLSKPILRVCFKLLAGCYAGLFPQPFRVLYLRGCRCIGWIFGKPPRQVALKGMNSGLDGGVPLGSRSILTASNSERRNSASREEEGSTGHVSISMTSTSDATAVSSEEAAGFLNNYQQWSLLLHTHWWAWDVYKKFIAYMLLSFWCTFVHPYFLRVLWGVPGPSAQQAN